jgi:hypothetical protein
MEVDGTLSSVRPVVWKRPAVETTEEYRRIRWRDLLMNTTWPLELDANDGTGRPSMLAMEAFGLGSRTAP